jgi:hypothetical protein
MFDEIILKLSKRDGIVSIIKKFCRTFRVTET